MFKERMYVFEGGKQFFFIYRITNCPPTVYGVAELRLDKTFTLFLKGQGIVVLLSVTSVSITFAVIAKLPL